MRRRLYLFLFSAFLVLLLSVAGLGLRHGFTTFYGERVTRTIEPLSTVQETNRYALRELAREIHEHPQAKWYTVAWKTSGGGTTMLIYDAVHQNTILNTTCGAGSRCKAHMSSVSGLTRSQIEAAALKGISADALGNYRLGMMAQICRPTATANGIRK